MANDTTYDDTRKEAAVDAINTHCETQREYDTTHQDAGDSYSHMPREGDTQEMEARLVTFCKDNGIEFGDLEPDELIEAALDNFKMVAGTVYGMSFRNDKDFFQLDSYPVQEIEISLESLEIPMDLIQAVAKECDAHISDSGLAYVTTDAVWFAAIHRDDLSEAVAVLVERKAPEAIAP